METEEDKALKMPGCIVGNQHLSCFEELTEDEKRILEDHTMEVSFKKGESIAKQGAFASNVIFLKSGLVKVYLEGDSRHLILEIVPPERLLSLSSLFEGNSTFLYSAATYVESTANLIDARIFRQLIHTNAHFASRIINILNENTAQLYSRFYALTCKQAHGRVADILLCLSKKIYKSEKFELTIGRGDLAELTGLSQESVIRILKEFRKEKLIELNGKSMELLNLELLNKISHYG